MVPLVVPLVSLKMNFETNVKYDSEKSIKRALGSIALYWVFIVVTTVVAVAARHHYMYYFNHAIKRHFMVYEHVVTYDEWWFQLTDVFVPDVLQQTEDNNNTGSGANVTGTNTQHTVDEVYILHENILLGTPRLRQIRVEETQCTNSKSFIKHFHSICYPQYSWQSQKMAGEHIGTEYRSSNDLSTMPITGRMYTYWGGSFVQNLHRDLNETLYLVGALAELGWLDRGTRLMIFEFTLYNHNTDLLNNVKILGEVPATGGVILFLEVKAVQKYAVWTGSIWIILAAIIFYLMAMYYLIGEILMMRNRGCKKYIKNFWNIGNLVILILVGISFSYNIFHPIYLRYYLRDATAKPNEYHSLDIICWLNTHYMNLMAVLVFLVWVKVFQFFTFNKVALQLNMTFVKCYKDLLGFVCIFLILFFSYAVLGLLLFGDAHVDFFSFPIAFWSVMRMVLADFDYEGVEKANRVLGPLYFLSFILVVYFILINMFLAIIFDTFREVKNIEITENNQLPQFLKKCSDKAKAVGKRAINALGLGKQTKSTKGGVPQREVGSDNEPPFPPAARPAKKVQVSKNEILQNYFETVQNKRDAEQIDKLTKHIAALEEILAKMNDDIKRLEAETPDPSTRPEPPRQAKAPPRVKVFIKRKK